MASVNSLFLPPRPNHYYESVHRGGTNNNLEASRMTTDTITARNAYINLLHAGQVALLPTTAGLALVDANLVLDASNFPQAMVGYMQNTQLLTADRTLVFPPANVIIAAMSTVLGNISVPGAQFDL